MFTSVPVTQLKHLSILALRIYLLQPLMDFGNHQVPPHTPKKRLLFCLVLVFCFVFVFLSPKSLSHPQNTNFLNEISCLLELMPRGLMG